MGLDASNRGTSSYDVICGFASLRQAIVHTAVPGLDIVPSTVDLAGAELELIDAERRGYRLRDAVEAAAVAYDYIIIDCPPGLGLLNLNALAAADSILVPLQCEFFALEGLSQLLRTVARVRRTFNPRLQILGVVLTMFDRRNNLSDQVARDVRGVMGDKVYDTIIPRNVRVSEAPSFGKPVLLYDHRCAGADAYIRLAREILARESRPEAA